MDILDQLFNEAKPSLPSLLSGEEPKRPSIAKVRYTHDAMVDLIIANPAISQNEIAAHFGYSASWISNVIASDAFQSRLSERAKEVVDPLVIASVQQRFEGLVMRSLEVLQQKLDRPADQIPDQLALRALEVSSRAAGYGAKPTQQVSPVTVELHLEQMGDRLTHLLRRRKDEAFDPVIEEIAGG